MRPRTQYAKCGDLNIAYQVTGEGPLDLVYVPGWVSNLDYAWEYPGYARVLERLGSFARLIRFDKRGTGLSDREVGFPTLEQRMEDVRAVMDAAGSERAALLGTSEGGNMSTLFAATYPERTVALILYGCFAKGLWAPDYPWASTREELDKELAAIARDWGGPFDLQSGAPSLAQDESVREWFAAYMRNSASPKEAISIWDWNAEIDVRGILPSIHVPGARATTSKNPASNQPKARPAQSREAKDPGERTALLTPFIYSQPLVGASRRLLRRPARMRFSESRYNSAERSKPRMGMLKGKDDELGEDGTIAQ